MSGTSGPETWALPGTAGFAQWVGAHIAPKAQAEAGMGQAGAAGYSLMAQQHFVRAFLSPDAPYRGLILYHGLGSGKTCTAIAAMTTITASVAPASRVFVMLPASLRNNYMKEVQKCGARDLREGQAWAFRAGVVPPWAETGTPLRMFKAHGGAWEADIESGTPFGELKDAARQQIRAQLVAKTHAQQTLLNYNGLTAARVKELCSPGGVARDGEGGGSPFDNAVVIIDEVHDFVSRVMHGGVVAPLYESLMAAKRCRVLLLSGTPLVNRPEELAYMANIAHGPLRVHEFRLHGQSLTASATDALRASPYVREFHVDMIRPVVHVRLLPDGFIRDERQTWHVKRADDADTHGMAVADLRAALAAVGCKVAAVKANDIELLPTDGDEFRKVFIDEQAGRVLNSDVLARRLQGIVSYFRGHDPALYPSVKVDIVRLTMTARQFAEYTVQRAAEKKREDAAARMAAMRRHRGGPGGASGDADTANYRPFSRLICNCAFPEGLLRPHPADVRAELGLDTAADSGEDGDRRRNGAAAAATALRRRADTAYHAALDKAIAQLRQAPGRLAVAPSHDAGLDELSPKFAAITRRLQALRASKQGTAIVYSSFREVEGLGILSAALDANGFEELRLERAPEGGLQLVPPRDVTKPRYIVYSNDDPEQAQALLSLFNGQLQDVSHPAVLSGARALLQAARPKSSKSSKSSKSTKSSKSSKSSNNAFNASNGGPSNLNGDLAVALLITRSGAQGISTIGVREVHVVEPFWHANMIEQVIGRAVRAHSHDALPPDQRNVTAYVYMMSFDAEQAKQHGRDDGLTSDEAVHEIAQRKRRVLQGLLGVMRSSAVDCGLAHTESEGIVCFRPPSGVAAGAELVMADTAGEDARSGPARRQRPAGLVAVEGEGGKTVLKDPGTGVMYDRAELEQHKRMVPVGWAPRPAPAAATRRATRARPNPHQP